MNQEKEALILIAEDQPISIGSLKAILGKQGYHLIFATDGKQALEKSKELHPHLILLDVIMPAMSGYEVCEHLKKDPVTRKIPVIFLTSKTQTPDIVKGFVAGAVDYITKPFTPTELLARVSTHLKLAQSMKIIEEQRMEIIQKNETMENDLNIARNFQKKLLADPPAVPFLEIKHLLIPFSAVSGDMFHFAYDREGNLSCFIGDAVGHSIKAAFITMMIKTTLVNLPALLAPHKVMSELNKSLYFSEEYMTGCYLKVSSDGKIAMTNAGHPPLIIHTHEGSVFELSGPGVALGMFEDEPHPYQDIHYQLKKGDRFFLYTDGIIEIQDENQDFFGIQSLITFIETHQHIALRNVLDQLMLTLGNLQNSFHDDMTAIGFEYKG